MKKNYLKEANFNHNNFYQTRKSMFIDDRIMKNSTGSYPAVILYATIEDKISLSNDSISKGEMKYLNSDGETVCFFSQDDAKEELSMSDTMYKGRKKFLKEVGLINYGKQKKKEVGVSIPITYTPWDIWVEQNGLYSNGEWIIEPTSADFYNPSDIVTVQPNIVPKKEKVEPEPEESLSPVEISEEQPINEITIVEKHVEERSSISGFYSIILCEKTSDGIRHETNLMDRFKKASGEQILEFARKNYEVRQVEIPIAQ
jgi:hypothetical protein